jgi:hypothetical protein
MPVSTEWTLPRQNAAASHRVVIPLTGLTRHCNTRPRHAVAATVHVEDLGLARAALAELRLPRRAG